MGQSIKCKSWNCESSGRKQKDQDIGTGRQRKVYTSMFIVALLTIGKL
jgi:uncharacterized protein Veg